MKKKLLFLLGGAVLSGLFSMNVMAQDWTASEVAEGYYMLYNVGTGQYLTRGNGWGTQASITTPTTIGNGIALKLAGSGSDFKMFTGINGDAKGLEHLDGGTIYTDQANGKNSTWTFTQVGTDNGPVYTIVSKDNHGGGAGVYLTAGVDGTIVTPGSDGTINGAKWKLMSIPAQPIGMDAASESNPVDATSLIVNANFSFPAILKSDSWTMVSSNYNACGGNTDNPCAESYKAAFTLSQELTLPKNGIYELTAQAAVTEYAVTGADMPVVYAGDQSTPFTAMTEGEASMGAVSTQFTAGKYVVGPIRVVVATGKLTIGVRGTRTDTWCVWDNFKLTYKGVDLSALRDVLQAQIDAVPALEGTTTAAAYNAAKNYADGINVSSLTTEAAISTASSELAALVDAAKALQANYSRYNEIKTAAKEIISTLDTTEPDATLAAATTKENTESAIAGLRAAFLTGLSNVTIPDDPGYIDVTAVMVDNASVSTNTDYWTIEGTPNGGYSFGVCNYGECEFYNCNFNFYQTLALCKGTWQFGVTGFHRAGNHSTYFYAGDDKKLIDGVESSVVNTMAEAKTYFDDGKGKVDLKFALDEAKSIKIGIDNKDTETDKWTIFRNFTLFYFGEVIDMTPYKQALAEAIAAANTVEGTVPTGCFNAIKAVITEKNKEYTTVSDYQDAKAAIEEAVATYASSEIVAAYATYPSVKAAVQALYDVAGYEELTAGSHATLGTALSTAANDMAAATTAAAIETVKATLKTAGVTYAGAANPTDEASPFNLTFMLTNPDVTNCTGWAPADGWYNDQSQPTQNSQVMNSNTAVANTADPSKYAFYEYWSSNTEPTSGYVVYQKVTLPAGTYRMTALAVAGYGSGHRYGIGTDDGGKPGSVSSEDNKQITFSAGNTDGTLITTTTLEDAKIDFINDATQEVKIGLKAHEGNTSNWMGIGYVELFKVPANEVAYTITTSSATHASVVAKVGDAVVTEAVALAGVTLAVTVDEGYAVDKVTVSYTDGENVVYVTVNDNGGGIYTFQMPAYNVTVTVTTVALTEVTMCVKADVQFATFIAPFAVAIPDGVKAYFVDDMEADGVTLKFTEITGTIPANKPVLLESSTGVNTVVKGKAVAPGDLTVGFLTGVYADQEAPVGSYVLQKHDDNVAFFLVGEDVKPTVKANHCYLMAPIADAPILRIGGTTNIANVEAEAEAVIYDLTGRRVDAPAKGIYIVNGKKVFVK